MGTWGMMEDNGLIVLLTEGLGLINGYRRCFCVRFECMDGMRRNKSS